MNDAANSTGKSPDIETVVGPETAKHKFTAKNELTTSDVGAAANSESHMARETVAETLTAMATAVSTEQMSSTLKVLIVEDDPVFVHLVSRYLRQDKKHNFAVEICENANDAINLCLKQNYDVILIDYTLPDLSGAELISELRSRLTGPPPPTILLTADNSGESARSAEQSNASDFLLKQVVSTSSLSRSIQNAISKFNLQNAINKRSAALEKVNNDLTAKNREIRDYYQKVSHEVKTPLAAAREFIAIIRDEICGPLTEEQKEVINLAVTSCDQISNHFNDLVQITRLDAGRVLLRKKKTTVDHIIRRSVAATAATLAETDMQMFLEIENPEAVAFMDADRITQVLSNLIGNAIKFTEPGGTLGITVRNNMEGNIEFCVSDTGCGIAEEHRLKIFERLYQVFDESHEFLGAGLGLGLTIASEIVQLHHGKIWVESELGVGSQFYFWLPATKIPDDNAHDEDIQNN